MTGDDRCDQCGGETASTENGGVPVLECVDCGNVVGLVEPDVENSVDESTPTKSEIDTGTITATDGAFQQLLTLLRTQGNVDDAVITAERLLLATESSEIVVTAEGDSLHLRETDEADD